MFLAAILSALLPAAPSAFPAQAKLYRFGIEHGLSQSTANAIVHYLNAVSIQQNSLGLLVPSPFWQQWWFWLLVAACVCGVLVFLYRYRMARLLEIERMRVRIASDLHDDVGSTLTKIALYSDLVRDSSDREKADDLMQKIGTMSREMVAHMSDIVWSIDARNDTMEDLIDRMRDFAVSILTPRSVDVSINAGSLDTSQKLPIEIRQNLHLIFKEAVHNIAKHSCASAVSIELRQSDGKLSMMIADNGKSVDGFQKLTGQGLRNMKMRAEQIGASFEFSNNNGFRISVVADPTAFRKSSTSLWGWL